MSHTAADMIHYIKNYRYNKSDFILDAGIHNLLSCVYTYLFWMIFTLTIGLYYGVFMFTNYLLIPELFLIVGIFISWMIGMRFTAEISTCLDYNLSYEILCECMHMVTGTILLACFFHYGVEVATILHHDFSIDPRFLATVLLNLSMMFSCFKLSLSLRHVCSISLISGLGITRFVLSISTIEPDGFTVGFVVTVLISAAVMIFVSQRVSLLARVEHVGWLYFSGILLTWLATDFLMPYACFTYGEFLVFHAIPYHIESGWVLDRESYLIFRGHAYKSDFWNNYYQYHLYIQLGMLGMCGFVIHQTQLLVKEYRGCPPYHPWGWRDAVRHSSTLLENFIKLWRPLIQPIIWGVIFLSSYLWMKLSPFIDKISTMFMKLSMIFLQPCYIFFIKLENMCLETLIYLISNISRFFKILYDTLDLLHAFVAIVYIYIIYRVYLYLQ